MLFFVPFVFIRENKTFTRSFATGGVSCVYGNRRGNAVCNHKCIEIGVSKSLFPQRKNLKEQTFVLKVFINHFVQQQQNQNKKKNHKSSTSRKLEEGCKITLVTSASNS